YGLVMGISIKPKDVAEKPNTEPTRDIRIVQREKLNVYGREPGMSFVIDGTPETANAEAFPIPGPLMVLERGKRVAVKIVNASNERASMHWHGIELESYPDGVPGWSGSGNNIIPSIAPNDSLTVKWTPKRAGSFMYHSHFNEAMQMGRGLYGPIIVLEPGDHFDANTDKVLFFGTAGAAENVVFGPFPHWVMNGKEQPAPMELKAGTRYRFRLFNLAGDSPLIVSLKSGAKPIEWRAVAKDGYPLPPSQAKSKDASLMFDPGEIYDFEYTPTVKGDLTLTFGAPPLPPSPAPLPGTKADPAPLNPNAPDVKVAVHVR
ncbi:MAG: multicopper oxidase domain-containing protein, partial [Gemmatimonadaceae bacterium]